MGNTDDGVRTASSQKYTKLKNFKEAESDVNWIFTMHDDKSIKPNKVWKLVLGLLIIYRTKWVFKINWIKLILLRLYL